MNESAATRGVARVEDRCLLDEDRRRSPNLANDFEAKSGHPPDPAERKNLIHDHMENEILYREAKKQGIMEDPRVRRLMILVQREVMEPVVPDPSDTELEAMRQKEVAGRVIAKRRRRRTKSPSWRANSLIILF